MTVTYDFVTLQTVEVSWSVTDVTFMSFLHLQQMPILRVQLIPRQTAEIDIRVPTSVTQFDLSE